MAAENEESKDKEHIDNVFVIGNNDCGQFGFGHTNAIKELTQWTQNISIKDIDCGWGFTIITDKNNIVWCSGRNEHGQLGLGYFSQNIQQFTENKYFINNNINIKSVMTSADCATSFFLSQTNQLYGCGWNESNQLGINNKQNTNEPLLMNNISNIADAEGGYRHTILLDNNGIVYSTKYTYEYSNYGQNGDGIYNFSKNDIDDNENIGFKPILFFEKKKIIQISAGSYHSLFLDSKFGIWSCGHNSDGQLGLQHFIDMSTKNPQLITYFVENKIKINKICCGGHHNLCIDNNGIIYAFGKNNYGQCALTNKYNKTNTPTVISALSNDKIIDIQCGFNHSYCGSDSGQHWLFGSNEYNECGLCKKNVNINKIYSPFCINECVNEITNGKEITEIYFGYENTWIITGLKSIEFEEKKEFIDAEIKQCNYVLSSLDIKNGYIKCFDDNYNELQFKMDKNDNELIKQIINTQNIGMEMKKDVFVTINEIFYNNKNKKQTVIKAFIKNDNDINETENNEIIIENDNTKEKIKKLEDTMTEKDNQIATLKKRLSVASMSNLLDITTVNQQYTIEEWLRDVVKLPEYIETFVEHGFDMEILMDVTMDELKNEIGIKKLGHRKKIMKAIKKMSNTD